MPAAFKTGILQYTAADKVIIGSMDGKLYQIDVSNGKVVTQYEVGASISSTCAVSNGWIFVGCEDGNIYAFSTNNKSP